MLEALLSGRKRPNSGLITYNGITTGANLVSGASVATSLGLTVGTETSQAITSEWLSFTTDKGKALHIASVRFRFNLSWSQINARNGINGSTTIVIGGKLFKIRLLSSEEWNTYMYAVSATRPVTYNGDRLAELSDAVLGLSFANGPGTICSDLDGGYCTVRSLGSPHAELKPSSTAINNSYGWRPVVEEM